MLTIYPIMVFNANYISVIKALCIFNVNYHPIMVFNANNISVIKVLCTFNVKPITGAIFYSE